MCAGGVEASAALRGAAESGTPDDELVGQIPQVVRGGRRTGQGRARMVLEADPLALARSSPVFLIQSNRPRLETRDLPGMKLDGRLGCSDRANACWERQRANVSSLQVSGSLGSSPGRSGC